MYKITHEGKAYPDAVEILFEGVTSEPPEGAKLFISRELPPAMQEVIKSTLAKVLGEDCRATKGAQSWALPDAEVVHFTPPPIADKKHPAHFSKRREIIQREFVAALKGKHIDIMRWNVAEVPLAQFLGSENRVPPKAGR